MPTPEEREDDQLENEARDLARAIWQVVLISRNEAKASGLLGKASRMTLVQRIVALMKIVRGQRRH